MGPKKAQKQSNKAEQKAKTKIIEDKTFGLKNKNKSKAVQKYVHSVQQNVKHMGGKDAQNKEKDREQKKADKEAKKLRELEMAKLGYAEEKKKKAAVVETSASADAAAERGEYLWTADDFEAVEHDASRLEETLERERQAVAKRTDLTPVNEKTFKKWWEDKQRRLAKEREAARRAQIRAFKSKGGGISGRLLFEHDASLFVDDDDADAEVEKEVDEEWERAKREAQAAAEEARRAKAKGGSKKVDELCEADKGKENLTHDIAVAERHLDPTAAGGDDEDEGGGGGGDGGAEDGELFDGEDLPDDDEEEEEDEGGGKEGGEE